MTKNHLLLAFAAASILNLNAAFAQDAGPVRMRLSPEEAVGLAIKNNLTLERQRIGTDTKRRASDYVWNQFLPTVNLSGGASLNSQNQTTKYDPPTVLTDKQTTDVFATGYQGQIQAQLNINMAMFEGIKSIKMDYEGGLLSLEQAKLQLERDVRKAYFEILLVEEQLKQLLESQRNAEDQARSAETQYRAGRQPELNYLQARVSADTMKPSIDQASNGLRLAKSNFAMTLGLPLDTDFELSNPAGEVRYVPLDPQALVRQARDNNPEILVQKQQLRTLMSQRKAQVYQKKTPNLSLGWTGGLSGSGSKSESDPASPQANSPQNSDVFSTSSTFTLGLSYSLMSLFPFSLDAQSVKDLDNNVKTASIGLTQAEQGVELDITNRVYTLEQIRSSIEAQRATAALAERSYSETLRAYNGGLQNLLQVQSAELQLRTARLNLYQQESGYLQGLIDLEYSIGAPFGSLSSRPE
ncbi:MAG: TolC family protein [Spirochaetaceae bacterium]|jgi:outer membrane protein TolC|nr:TolC family protein [Spirochaetaceae bacterium]